MQTMIAANHVRSVGVMPLFPKSYLTPGAYYARSTSILAIGLFGKLGAKRWLDRLRVPDIVDRNAARPLKVVIKSIASHGRVRLMTEAMPAARMVYIVRNPLGYVASMRRGINLRKFERPIPLEECLGTEQAARHAMTRETFDALPLIEKLAWHWVLRNEKALDELAGYPRALVVRYDALCANPLAQARALVDFAGLDWDRRTEAFLAASTRASGPDGYYRLYKNSAESAGKWRLELTLDEQSRIYDIVRNTSLAGYSPEPPDGRAINTNSGAPPMR
jgi:hypothetical protein